jgi:hypothetical protein
MPDKTKIIFSDGMPPLVVDAAVEKVRNELEESKRGAGALFRPFTTAQGKQVHVAGDKVAYLEAE